VEAFLEPVVPCHTDKPPTTQNTTTPYVLVQAYYVYLKQPTSTSPPLPPLIQAEPGSPKESPLLQPPFASPVHPEATVQAL